MANYPFVNVNEFTPNNGDWTTVGNVASYTQQGAILRLTMANGGPAPILYFLAATVFRVRFNPAADYSSDNSYAVVADAFSGYTPTVTDLGNALQLLTNSMRVVINKAPFGITVYRGEQLIHADNPGYNLIYDGTAVANLKVYPANALYCGFGEKAGAQLFKNQFTMTFFNYDNFMYSSGPLPEGEGGGPLNPSETLYNSTPLLIETNPNPVGANQGAPYSYGLFLDNPCQTYINVGASDYSNMFGKYYLGALYGDLNYYFFLGNTVRDVIAQYTQLTGRAPLPPKYVFGYHQGCYGYYDRYKLSEVANAYRAARIPIDGLHIDVDFQDNYRTFTSSNLKFPNVAEMFADLHTIGFKCCTNITSLVSNNPLDENGNKTTYPALQSGLKADAFIYATRAGQGESPNLFVGQESYGQNFGSNPYPYPPLSFQNGVESLGSSGYYPDFGRSDVQTWWGQQYQYLLSVGLDFIWQDMTCPAIVPNFDNNTPDKTFPLDLMQSSFGQYQANALIHNAYSLNLCQATYNGLNLLRPNLRNFIIARGGYAGMQRYAGLWTGDSASSWDFLSINIPEVLNLGLSGQPISGCDIGGFASGSASEGDFSVVDGQVYGQITNYELLTRWMNLGAFLPWYRNHYDGYVKQFQEPYQYGEPVPSNCRKYIEMRYRLLQVFYDAMYQHTQTGLPIVRPLFLNDPGDPQVYHYVNDQFFLGDHILVAPIVSQHDTANPPTPPVRDIYLPAGSQWYAYQDNLAPLLAPVNGGTLITNYYASLGVVPIYIRAGAIIPMRQLEQYVGELPQNPLTFTIYPGPDSTYELYLDDGLTTNYQTQQQYRLTAITHHSTGNSQTVTIQRQHDGYTPPELFFYLCLLGASLPSKAQVNGVPLSNLIYPTDAEAAAALAASPVNAFYFNTEINAVFIKVFDMAANTNVAVGY